MECKEEKIRLSNNSTTGVTKEQHDRLKSRSQLATHSAVAGDGGAELGVESRLELSDVRLKWKRRQQKTASNYPTNDR